MAELGARLGMTLDDPWQRFPEGSPEAALCAETADRLRRDQVPSSVPPAVPADFGRRTTGHSSTQQELGRFLLALTREAPDVARRVVTVAPDVASSTNLGGWLNKVGAWSPTERQNWFADDAETILHWRERPSGQHIELGIAEVNLVGLLGELGATWSRWGEPLFPIGTLYDPFVNRALEPWSFGIYGGGQSILVGTPSGVTLAPEGGAHQSIITPSVGLEQPGCVAFDRPSRRTSSGACLTRCRDSGARAAHPATCGSRRGRSTSHSPPCQPMRSPGNGAGRSWSRAGTRCAGPSARRSPWPAWGR